MALANRQHVEAVAILRQIVEQTREFGCPAYESIIAAEVWLKENHPAPAVYMAALSPTQGGGNAASD